MYVQYIINVCVLDVVIKYEFCIVGCTVLILSSLPSCWLGRVEWRGSSMYCHLTGCTNNLMMVHLQGRNM